MGKKNDLLPDADLNRTFRETDLRIAKITRVDYETQSVDIQWLDGGGGYTKLQLPQPGRTLRATIAIMPEPDSIVVCGFAPYTNQKKIPIILAYLPQFTQIGLNHDPIVTERIPIRKMVRTRFRKMYPGEVYLGSTQGSDLYMDENIHLQNAKHNELTLRSSDQTVIENALAGYTKHSGIEIKSGIVTRNRLQLDSEGVIDTEKENGLPASAITSDGRVYRPISVKTTLKDEEGNAIPPLYNSVYTEFKIKVKDVDDGTLAVNNEINGLPVDELLEGEDGTSDIGTMPDTVTELALGNLIGDDFSESGVQTYARHLRFSIFNGDDDLEGAPKLDVIQETGDPDNIEPQQSGMAYYLNCERPGQFRTVWAVDKTGSTQMYLSGPNRSWDIKTETGTKWVMGLNGQNGLSFDCFAQGAWNIVAKGQGTSSGAAYSLTTIGSYSGTYGTDQNGVSMTETFAGDSFQTYGANKTVEVRGNYTVRVDGIYEERFLGKKTENYVQDKTTNYGGAYTEIVVGNRNSQFGAGRDTTIASPDLAEGETTADSLTIIFGDKALDMTLGNYTIDLALGNIEETIVLGDRVTDIQASGNIRNIVTTGNIENSIVAGNFTASTQAGNVELSTQAGNVSLSTLTGSAKVESLTGAMDIFGGSGVKIESLAQITLSAPFVTIGASPLGGVVVGLPSGVAHSDYLTGLPLLGVATVQAGP